MQISNLIEIHCVESEVKTHGQADKRTDRHRRLFYSVLITYASSKKRKRMVMISEGNLSRSIYTTVINHDN